MTSHSEILGNVKGPGEEPNQYTFISSNNNATKIGEFVYFNTDKHDIIGRITDKCIIKSLPDSFMASPDISPHRLSGLLGLQDKNAELYEITVDTSGYFDKKLDCFINPRITPNPGEKVLLVPDTKLTDIINSKSAKDTGSACIGNLLTRSDTHVPVILNVKKLVSTHLSILASTGSGKSYTAGVLIEELLQHYNRASVLIVDPHNEYDTLKEIENHPEFKTEHYQPVVQIYPPERISVRVSSLTENDIKYLLPSLSDKMRYYLSIAFKNASRGCDPGEDSSYSWNLSDLCDELESLSESKPEDSATVDALLWRLRARIGNSKIFHDSKHIPLNQLFKPGQCTVLQLSEVDQEEQQVILSTLLRRINRARIDTHKGIVNDTQSERYIPYPVFILIEEAHRFAPANAPSVSENILKTILSEGRKFGVGVGLITQRPGKLNSDILSQCMTQMIMKIINPIDQNTIKSSVESAGNELLKELPSLTKGQVIVSGAAINTTVLCKVRPRITTHGGETIDAPECWMNYFSEQNQKNAKIEASFISKNAKSDTYKGLSI